MECDTLAFSKDTSQVTFAQFTNTEMCNSGYCNEDPKEPKWSAEFPPLTIGSVDRIMQPCFLQMSTTRPNIITFSRYSEANTRNYPEKEVSIVYHIENCSHKQWNHIELLWIREGWKSFLMQQLLGAIWWNVATLCRFCLFSYAKRCMEGVRQCRVQVSALYGGLCSTRR